MKKENDKQLPFNCEPMSLKKSSPKHDDPAANCELMSLKKSSDKHDEPPSSSKEAKINSVGFEEIFSALRVGVCTVPLKFSFSLELLLLFFITVFLFCYYALVCGCLCLGYCYMKKLHGREERAGRRDEPDEFVNQGVYESVKSSVATGKTKATTTTTVASTTTKKNWIHRVFQQLSCYN